MPPRHSADNSAAAADAHAMCGLSPLPHALVIHIFSLLPVDCRLRCAEVCRSWAAALREHAMWTRLDMTVASGVREPEEPDYTEDGDGGGPPGPWDALLRFTAARAGGRLRSLHVSLQYITHEALLEVAAANAGALREVHAGTDRPFLGLSADEAEALLGAAPLLDVLVTDLRCDDMDMEAARRALRNEAPFGPLRVRHLHAALGGEALDVVVLAADVAAHASLRGLSLLYAVLVTAAALDVVVDAALARRMHTVTLDLCGLSPASVPALARLLGGTALTTLDCSYINLSLNAPTAAVLAAALRANSTLTSLTLRQAHLYDDAAAAAELLGALTGHASVQTLSLKGNRVADADRAAVGAALGALVAADAPALTNLDVSRCGLGDDGMRALIEALPHNTHLQELNFLHNN
jgi:hypothetical protein